MTYLPEFHPKVDKEILRLDKPLRKDIRDRHIPRILEDPYRAGKGLSGSLAGLRSYSFTSNKIEYRIIYDIIEEKVTVLFLIIGSRENLYERLIRRLKR